MKKFLSLLLAAMMLLSCATAMATEVTFDINKVDSVLDGSAPWRDTDDTTSDADIDVSVITNYDSGEDKFGSEGEAATEIWLQVDATGQIDVTVPLVLVFQTNIDGGYATSPTDYKIINHSTADLVVTKIAATKLAQTEKTQPMEMVSYKNDKNENTVLTEDQYAVRIADIGGQAGKGEEVHAEYDLHTETAGGTVVLYENEAYNGGLFELKKAPKGQDTKGDGEPTTLKVEMRTGRLSFVTSRKDIGDADQMNEKKGIHLMTITYTVAIDTSDAYGEEITTANQTENSYAMENGNVLSGPPSSTGHTKIVEETTADAAEDNKDDDPSTGGSTGDDNTAGGGTTGDDNTAGGGTTGDDNTTGN